jgi:hypothetical protein
MEGAEVSDFDRELAKCIGNTFAVGVTPSREVVATCYRDTLRKLNSAEKEQVSEKWIDYVWDKVREFNIKGKNSEQIARGIFELIAKA